MSKPTVTEPAQSEEIANAITHGIGTLISVLGLVTILILTDIQVDPEYFIYGVSLVILYLTSTLYHSITHNKLKNWFRKFDHMAIFLLIAGTYTPFCINALDGALRWVLLAAVWICAIAGIVIKLFYTGKYEWLSIVFYVLMGWMAVFVISPIYEALSLSAFIYLLLGGLAYTGGVFFYMADRLKFSHSIWHLWVMAGSAFHFFSIISFL